VRHSKAPDSVAPDSGRVTGKPEVIRVRGLIARNRDCLGPLACVVA